MCVENPKQEKPENIVSRTGWGFLISNPPDAKNDVINIAPNVPTTEQAKIVQPVSPVKA